MNGATISKIKDDCKMSISKKKCFFLITYSSRLLYQYSEDNFQFKF